MKTPTVDFLGFVRTLLEHRVEFIVVGGVCGVLHGAPINTFDLDVVHSRKPANVRRLLKALDNLSAHYRMQPEKRLKPGVSHLSSPGHQLLITRFGPLDLLGSIGRGHSYEDLVKHSVSLRVGRGLTIQVLSLRKLIEVKEETADEKDNAVLPILRRTLIEKESSGT